MGGQEAVRKLWVEYAMECDGIIVVLDASDPTRYDEAREALTTLLRNK